MFKKYLDEVAAAIIVIFTSFNSKFPLLQEQDYQLSLKQEKINSAIVTTTITAVVYVIFFILDTWSLSSQIYTAALVRSSFFLFSVYVLYLIIKKEDVFVQYYQLIVAGYFLLAGLGIIFLLAIAQQSEIAADFYFSGIMLVIFTAHGSTYLQPNIALIVSATLTLITIVFFSISRSFDQIDTLYQILITCFMLISSVIAGVLCMDIRNRFSRKNFVLQANSDRLNVEKSHFFAAASHDIRQPLQAISFLVNTLRLQNSKSEKDELFERLENGVESMSDLLNSMLDVSKLDAHVIVPQPKHLSLTVLLEKLKGELNPFAKAKDIELIIAGDSYTLFADAILLEQVLNNLLSNAIRYTPSGSITLAAKNDSGDIEISVTDTGMGIADDNKDAIFNEFHQVDNPERDQTKGLGLGLSIVKRLCALQNWPLSVESTLGVGSCFSFKVPAGDSALSLEENTLDINNNLAAIDVIVIDDNEAIRFSLSNILNSWGCNVRSFESAGEACHTIKQLPTWQPKLLISDYRLRNNMTGIQAIEQVEKTLAYPIEAIIITGDTAPDEIIKIKKSGLIVLHKPIKSAQLRLVISQKMQSITE